MIIGGASPFSVMLILRKPFFKMNKQLKRILPVGHLFAILFHMLQASAVRQGEFKKRYSQRWQRNGSLILANIAFLSFEEGIKQAVSRKKKSTRDELQICLSISNHFIVCTVHRHVGPRTWNMKHNVKWNMKYNAKDTISCQIKNDVPAGVIQRTCNMKWLNVCVFLGV